MKSKSINTMYDMYVLYDMTLESIHLNGDMFTKLSNYIFIRLKVDIVLMFNYKI